MTANLIPAMWMPNAKISRIVVHWTAGANKASAIDREHYHIIIEDDGKLIRGIPSIDLNSEPRAKAGYAAHTLNCNTGSIGVSLCGMAGAIETPFLPGKYPITKKQWQTLPQVIAQLCRRYNIVIEPKTVLTHAEVQNTLGIKQRGKWDISRLPFDGSVIGAPAVGAQMREKAMAELTTLKIGTVK